METRPSHQNNFGLLRLSFALMVIVSHSIELVDGNRLREPLTQIFGSVSSGEFGVDGFFLVSGYLITQSFETSRSTADYLWKRVLRIYPGFVVASLFSLLIVGPLSGADMSALTSRGIARAAVYIGLLAPPSLPNSFEGEHYPLLNGSMWTISYEFRSYLLIIIAGWLGLFRYRIVLLLLIATLLIASILFTTEPDYFSNLEVAIVGQLKPTLRFTALFLSGAAFYVFRDMIVYRNKLALVAAILLALGLLNEETAQLSIPIFAGYLIFWLAFLPNTERFNQVNNKTDISYGTYLYAWPIQALAIRFIPGISPLLVLLITLVVATSLASLSWRYVEQPCLTFKRRRQMGTSLPP
jgi:peptidoglycan/LPS O-acetylase OafA/YrhL